MTRDDIIDMATQSGFSVTHTSNLGVELYLCNPKDLERFAQLVAAAEREAITEEYWSCVQSDLEHGVKSLNEEASRLFHISMPEVSKFGGWLEARGQQ